MTRMIFLQAAVFLWILCGVTSGDENVALQGKATQSSIYRDINFGYMSAAGNAIDGNLDPIFEHGSCSHANVDPSPWWRVDLLRIYSISQIKITNRGDFGAERLNGAEIRVGNSLTNNGNDNPRCAVVTSIPAGQTQSFPCNGIIGRYVNIIIPGRTEALHLCEVQVFANY